MKSALIHYSRFCSVMALGLLCASPVQASELIVESGPGRAGPLSWQSAELRYRPASAEGPGWTALLSNVRIRGDADSGILLSRLHIDCPSPSDADSADKAPSGPPTLTLCPAGELNWEMPEGQAGRAEVQLTQDSDRLRFGLDDDALTVSGHWLLQEGRLEGLTIELDAFDASLLLPFVSTGADLDVLYGQITARVTLATSELSGEWKIQGGGFDGREGQVAGDGLELAGSINGRIVGDERQLEMKLTQKAGELLIGPLYLPAPETPIEIALQLEQDAPDVLHVPSLSYDHPGVARLRAMVSLGYSDERWQVTEAELFELEADLQQAWPRWVDGLAASAGFSGLEASGSLAASARLVDGELTALDAVLEAFELSDPRGRFDIGTTLARIQQEASGIQLAMDLESLMVYGLPFGAARVRVAERDEAWILQEPLRLPLLDGAVVIDRLELEPDPEARRVTLDANIEPLSLEQLTTTLGWPEFGGELSGFFPGVELRDDRLNVTGGINVNAFSGQIQLSELVVERPFGTLPALAAQVEINRLDLLELTGAFNFGRMEGEVSGWMRDLRLLDWRPVAMDSRLFTHDDVSRRRISQRAVDNLSNLGGGLGGALIGNTVLSVFEDFPYRRAGLACRLSNNICYIDGVAEHESGGFYIVEGRGLPHLDIIGHRRLVDWPQLLSQLEAATR